MASFEVGGVSDRIQALGFKKVLASLNLESDREQCQSDSFNSTAVKWKGSRCAYLNKNVTAA